jgi:hypothetical protein
MAEPEELPASANPLSFIFGGTTGVPTYAELQRRRAIAQALASRRMPAPKTVGEGMTYLGESLADIAGQWALDKSERAYDADSAKLATKAYPEAVPVPAIAPRSSAVPSPAPPAASGPMAGNVPVVAQGGDEGGDGDIRAQIVQTLQNREQPQPPPVQLAALNTGSTMSDALPPGAERMAAQDQPNPPIVTSEIAPMRVAGGPVPATGAAPPTAAPDVAPYVSPRPTMPAPAAEVPFSPRYYDARKLLSKHPDPNDPYHVTAQGMLAEETHKQKQAQDRLNEQYRADVARAEAALAKHEQEKATVQERGQSLTKNKLDLENARRAEQVRNIYGDIPEHTRKYLEESRDTAMSATNTLQAINQAKVAMDAGTVFGAGAELKLMGYRAAALAGNKEAAKIVAATQIFKTSLGPMIQDTVRKYGGSQISNIDLKFAREMGGQDISQDPATAATLLRIGEQVSNQHIKEHGERVNNMIQGQPATAHNTLRETYRVPGMLPSVPIGGPEPAAAAPRAFATEAEAAASGLPRGTPVIINGRRGRID